MSGLNPGASMLAVKPSIDQPRPKGPQASRCALASPQSRSLSRAYSSALLRLGEPVKRGPVTSVMYPTRSMIWEWFKAASRMRAAASRSAFSCENAAPAAKSRLPHKSVARVPLCRREGCACGDFDIGTKPLWEDEIAAGTVNQRALLCWRFAQPCAAKGPIFARNLRTVAGEDSLKLCPEALLLRWRRGGLRLRVGRARRGPRRFRGFRQVHMA